MNKKEDTHVTETSSSSSLKKINKRKIGIIIFLIALTIFSIVMLSLGIKESQYMKIDNLYGQWKTSNSFIKKEQKGFINFKENGEYDLYVIKDNELVENRSGYYYVDEGELDLLDNNSNHLHDLCFTVGKWSKTKISVEYDYRGNTKRATLTKIKKRTKDQKRYKKITKTAKIAKEIAEENGLDEYPEPTSCELTPGSYTCGLDFEEGTYSISVLSGKGNVYCKNILDENMEERNYLKSADSTYHHIDEVTFYEDDVLKVTGSLDLYMSPVE